MVQDVSWNAFCTWTFYKSITEHLISITLRQTKTITASDFRAMSSGHLAGTSMASWVRETPRAETLWPGWFFPTKLRTSKVLLLSQTRHVYQTLLLFQEICNAALWRLGDSHRHRIILKSRCKSVLKCKMCKNKQKLNLYRLQNLGANLSVNLRIGR